MTQQYIYFTLKNDTTIYLLQINNLEKYLNKYIKMYHIYYSQKIVEKLFLKLLTIVYSSVIYGSCTIYIFFVVDSQKPYPRFNLLFYDH
jgi:hypothetical protein